jgi:molecular chaperone GrpE
MTDDRLAPQDGRAAADAQPDAPLAAAADAPALAGGARSPQTLQEERDRFYDQLLRKTAEFDNYRKRTEKERREQVDRITGDVLLDVLPILDDLERALKAEAGGDAADAYRKGVELIHRQLLDLLRRRGVSAMDVVGRDFDPHWHQAVTTEPRDGAREGEILEELRRGYVIGERLLRPAMVKVARS